MKKRTFTIVAVGALLVAAWVVAEIVVDQAGTHLNPLRDPGPYVVSENARAVHRELLVADLHADSLLWNRDLLDRGKYGHTDLPRLVEGGVALQVFGVVTKVPKGLNFERNTAETDRITALAMVSRWPPRSWFSLFERARYQARKLERLTAASDGRLLLIRTRVDLDTLVERRQAGDAVVGALLGLEGAQALEGDLGNLRRLYDVGLRMIGLAHFFDTAVSGSAHGVEQGGLTELGRQVMAEAEDLGIAIDLAHASPATFRDVTRAARRPVVVSHTGVRGTCAGPRNLSDDDLEALAATGGVAGVALFPGATCGDDVAATVAAILHVIGVVGADYVALGSDFDGTITAPIDSSGLALVTEALIDRGVTRRDIAKIMGGNVLRVLRQTLP